MFPNPTRAAVAPTDRAARPTGRWATRTLATGLGTIAALALTACGGGNDASAPKLGFAAVPKNKNDVVTLPAGYQMAILHALGDPLAFGEESWKDDGSESAESYNRRIGDGHDGMYYFGLSDAGKFDANRSDRGLLCVNHEYVVGPNALHPNGRTAGATTHSRKRLISCSAAAASTGALRATMPPKAACRAWRPMRRLPRLHPRPTRCARFLTATVRCTRPTGLPAWPSFPKTWATAIWPCRRAMCRPCGTWPTTSSRRWRCWARSRQPGWHAPPAPRPALPPPARRAQPRRHCPACGSRRIGGLRRVAARIATQVCTRGFMQDEVADAADACQQQGSCQHVVPAPGAAAVRCGRRGGAFGGRPLGHVTCATSPRWRARTARAASPCARGRTGSRSGSCRR